MPYVVRFSCGQYLWKAASNQQYGPKKRKLVPLPSATVFETTRSAWCSLNQSMKFLPSTGTEPEVIEVRLIEGESCPPKRGSRRNPTKTKRKRDL